MMHTGGPEEIQGVRVKKLLNYIDERGVIKKITPNSTFGDEPSTILISSNNVAGAIRGFHFQIQPFAEKKLITCLRGSVFDAIIDLRVDSITFMKIAVIELSEENSLQLSLPIGIAHGFQSLSDNSVVHYCLTSEYSAPHAMVINPINEFKDLWPLTEKTLSKKDIAGLNLNEAVNKFTKSQLNKNL
jgi:dTDP-4-dehydrorhamnose 3,5-epimerase